MTALNKRQRYKQFYMDISDRVAMMSHAIRLKVGSIIVKDGNIIAFGWNGTPKSFDNECEYLDEDSGNLVTKPEVVHSEANAILKLAKSTESADGAEMFCTHAPCTECSKMIISSGIKTLFYKNEYRDSSGLDFLRKAGVNVVKFTAE